MSFFSYLKQAFSKNSNSNRDIGNKGEDIACKYLKKHGYKILRRNFQIRGGEIDIIATKDTKIHFVEVKFRTSFSYGSGAGAVNNEKISNIIYTAQRFLHDNCNNPKISALEPTIDVIEIFKGANKKPIINHYKDLDVSRVKRK